MNIKRILIFCIALSLLAYAQTAPTEDLKPEDYKASTVSPLDFIYNEHEEDHKDEHVEEVRKPEDYTASTVSPFEFMHNEAVNNEIQPVEEVRKPEDFKASTVSPLDFENNEHDDKESGEDIIIENTTERPIPKVEENPIEKEIVKESPENINKVEIVKESTEKPEIIKEIPQKPKKPKTPKKPKHTKKEKTKTPKKPKHSKKEKPEIIDEINISYIDENGNEVNYDKNLYYCENCNEDIKDKNGEVYTITEEENYEMNGKEEIEPNVEFVGGLDYDNTMDADEEEYDENEENDDNEEEEELDDDNEEEDELNDDLDDDIIDQLEEPSYDDQDYDVIEIEEQEAAFDDDEEGSGLNEE